MTINYWSRLRTAGMPPIMEGQWFFTKGAEMLLRVECPSAGASEQVQLNGKAILEIAEIVAAIVRRQVMEERVTIVQVTRTDTLFDITKGKHIPTKTLPVDWQHLVAAVGRSGVGDCELAQLSAFLPERTLYVHVRQGGTVCSIKQRVPKTSSLLTLLPAQPQ